MDKAALTKRVVLIFIAALAVVGIMLFVPAGTLDYWQAWVYMAIVFVPASFVLAYFLKNDPKFLERRFKTREKEVKQKTLIKIASVVFFIGFLIPGLDRRFGWSNVPFEFVVAADAIVVLGYALVCLVFRENSYAGRTIRVEKGQKVISTGPYAFIRHPMYLGSLLIYIATSIALGSYWALPPFLLMIPVIIYRIFNEEDVLKRELKGYTAYCQKTRYRLLPFVW
ncbi:MAG: hypothetical protein Sv326_0502 [Candidatus Fermentimicrarchaeum limneticum]|uniref:Isoprenylcysteine carboxyl methyltransferase n=1 Tax=Fermentimicrarchaeum limneticum TaxID=2795018 RepID=A0A7D6B9Z1_FERL1|nr:MAG: hypothetical protein Sv326_0502 [Candidatus Fermentimicrarchaeum limneticum]